MTHYDIIGDIHGHAEELRHLLTRLGYRRSGHGYQHDERQAVFVGDFIDLPPYKSNRSQRIHRRTRIPRSQPTFGLQRQTELYQRAAGVVIRMVSLNAVGMVSG